LIKEAKSRISPKMPKTSGRLPPWAAARTFWE